MLRRLVFAAVSLSAVPALAVLAPTAATAAGPAAPADPPVGSFLPSPSALRLPWLAEQDSFSVTVSAPGASGAAGAYELECDPASGTHPAAQAACDRLRQLADEKKDPFAPVSEGAMCTMQYGGEATARVTGTWQGRGIDAVFNRTNGCEIARWQTLEPLLPTV